MEALTVWALEGDPVEEADETCDLGVKDREKNDGVAEEVKPVPQWVVELLG